MGTLRNHQEELEQQRQRSDITRDAHFVFAGEHGLRKGLRHAVHVALHPAVHGVEDLGRVVAHPEALLHKKKKSKTAKKQRVRNRLGAAAAPVDTVPAPLRERRGYSYVDDSSSRGGGQNVRKMRPKNTPKLKQPTKQSLGGAPFYELGCSPRSTPE